MRLNLQRHHMPVTPGLSMMNYTIVNRKEQASLLINYDYTRTKTFKVLLT